MGPTGQGARPDRHRSGDRGAGPFPDQFPDVHIALFAARHDEGRDLRDEAVVRAVLEEDGVDGDEVFAAIADGWPRQAFRARPTRRPCRSSGLRGADLHRRRAVAFVRIMTRPEGDSGTGPDDHRARPGAAGDPSGDQRVQAHLDLPLSGGAVGSGYGAAQANVPRRAWLRATSSGVP